MSFVSHLVVLSLTLASLPRPASLRRLSRPHNSGPDQVMVDKATEMAKDLLEVVTEEHGKARAVLDQPFQPQGFGGMQPGQGWGPHHGQGQQQQQQQQGGYGGPQGGQQPYQGGYQVSCSRAEIAPKESGS